MFCHLDVRQLTKVFAVEMRIAGRQTARVSRDCMHVSRAAGPVSSLPDGADVSGYQRISFIQTTALQRTQEAQQCWIQ